MTDKSARGRRARARGRDFERRVAKYLNAELVPLSGALGGKFSGDVRLGELQIQCKKVNGAMKTQRRWLDEDNSDVLIQSNFREKIEDSLVVMRLSTFKKIIEGAER